MLVVGVVVNLKFVVFGFDVVFFFEFGYVFFGVFFFGGVCDGDIGFYFGVIVGSFNVYVLGVWSFCYDDNFFFEVE